MKIALEWGLLGLQTQPFQSQSLDIKNVNVDSKGKLKEDTGEGERKRKKKHGRQRSHHSWHQGPCGSEGFANRLY